MHDLSSIHLARHVGDLCTHLYRSFNVDPNRVALNLEIADVTLDLDGSIRCGLVINELVSNALKHAFPDGRAGQITVRFDVLPERWYALVVADDGVGLPPGFDLSRSDSLGLQLVGDLAEPLGGSLTVTSERGTSLTLRFHDAR